jgi:hypothetical protein
MQRQKTLFKEDVIDVEGTKKVRVGPESIATLPPFSSIEGQKWFDQISSQ